AVLTVVLLLLHRAVVADEVAEGVLRLPGDAVLGRVAVAAGCVRRAPVEVLHPLVGFHQVRHGPSTSSIAGPRVPAYKGPTGLTIPRRGEGCPTHVTAPTCRRRTMGGRIRSQEVRHGRGDRLRGALGPRLPACEEVPRRAAGRLRLGRHRPGRRSEERR